MKTTTRWSVPGRLFHSFGQRLLMLLSALLLALPVLALAAPGDLDPSFDGGDSDAQHCEVRRIRERFRPRLNLPLRKGESNRLLPAPLAVRTRTTHRVHRNRS